MIQSVNRQIGNRMEEKEILYCVKSVLIDEINDCYNRLMVVLDDINYKEMDNIYDEYIKLVMNLKRNFDCDSRLEKTGVEMFVEGYIADKSVRDAIEELANLKIVGI